MEALKPMGLFTRRPALFALVFYAFGIVVGNYVPCLPIVLYVAAIISAVVGLVFHLRAITNRAAFCLYMALTFCGIAQYQMAISNFPPTHIKNFAEISGNVTIQGIVAEEPDVRLDRVYLTIEVDSLTYKKRQFASSGKLLLKINQPSNSFSFKDHVSFSGYMFAPGGPTVPGGFDYSTYLSNKEIFAMMVLPTADKIEIVGGGNAPGIWQPNEFLINKLVVPVRQFLLDGYRLYLPSEQAALLAGFVLGEKKDIPPATAQLFTDTGTLHLMAVSGSNVAIVVVFFMWLLSPLNRRPRILLTILAVIFFSFLTKNEPSVVRASVMAIVGLAGFYRRKHPDMIGLLGFAGLLLLIIKPLWLFNVGFQLSISACAGIVYFVPKFTEKIKPKKSIVSKILYSLVLAFITTAAAQIAVLPVTAQYFNRIPIVGLIANLPMLILAGILTIAGIAFLPFILIGGVLAAIVAWPLNLCLTIIPPMLNFFASLPGAVVNVNTPGIWPIALFYAAIYFISELLFVRRFSFNAGFVGLAIMSIIIWNSYIKGGPTESLTFLDCGEDRAIILHEPDGRNYLWFDCYEPGECQNVENNLLPYLRHSSHLHIDTLFTDDSAKLAKSFRNIHVSKFLQYNDLVLSLPPKTMADSPYVLTEFILSDKVNFVKVQSDNDRELLTGGFYYKVKATGGECILAGNIAPNLADGAIQKALLIELPWAVQPYGAVYEKLKRARPGLLVFSPDNSHTPGSRQRKRLTYMNENTLATSIVGSFRLRIDSQMPCIDHMLKP
jgi:competence protein ComEC